MILDVEERIQITDYFVIVTGMNRKQLRSIAEELTHRFKKQGLLVKSLEGDNLDSWICLDYGDVIVHLFQEEARRYYDLEFLWSDAPRVEWHLASA